MWLRLENDIMEKNELNKDAMGGTELLEMRLRSHLSNDLLDKFQIVCSRERAINPEKKRIFWAHDLAQDSEAKKALGGERYKNYDKIVFVSHWQQSMYQAYLGVPYSAGIVLRNGIELFESHVKPMDKIRLIYFSTPHRGLDILESVFSHMTKGGNNHDVELNVFSSFNLYGWAERDKPYKELFDLLDNHPQVNYNGSVTNDRIREELKRSHILAYPSTWPETSCLCLIESMCAGLTCVHSSLGALPETSMGITSMYAYTEQPNGHAHRFAAQLDADIKHIRNIHANDVPLVHNMRSHGIYDFNNIAREWEALLKSILTT
ncbi:MAG: FkbM family methyltransferase [Robiginitomaculum sp.]|nr:MAG: FkbM family methyltransferase [Robiginitomaculum sp.]